MTLANKVAQFDADSDLINILQSLDSVERGNFCSDPVP